MKRVSDSLIVGALITLCTPLAGAQWSAVTDPGTIDGIEFFRSGDDRLYAASSFGQVYASTDHGETWTAVAEGLPIGITPIVGLVAAGDWLVASRQQPDHYNYRSHREGGVWSAWVPLAYQDGPIGSFAVIGETLFAALGTGQVSRSNDHGDTWSPIAPPGPGLIHEIFAYAGRLFAAESVINSGQIYRSDDLGEHWTPVGTGLGSSYVTTHGQWRGRLLISVYHMGGIGTVWSSVNHGDDWERLTALPTSANINGLALMSDGRLAIGAGGSGAGTPGTIFLSDDLANWEDFTGDLPSFARPVNELVSHDGWLFKTGGSVTCYRAQHPQTSAIGRRQIGEPSAGLQMSVPSPLAGPAAVRFTLPQAGPVDVSVYDTAGRHVATLLRTDHAAAGTHHVVWGLDGGDGAPVPAGMYLVRLSAGDDGLGHRIAVLR